MFQVGTSSPKSSSVTSNLEFTLRINILNCGLSVISQLSSSAREKYLELVVLHEICFEIFEEISSILLIIVLRDKEMSFTYAEIFESFAFFAKMSKLFLMISPSE